MQLNELLTDEDAVSPVIGVILMVAITVILAAVIGTFVLGLGEQVQTTTPKVTFAFDFEEGATLNSNVCQLDSSGDQLTITHDGGDKVTASTMAVRDDDGASSAWADCSSAGSNSDIAAGDNAFAEVEGDSKVRIIWTSSGGGSSGTIGSWTGPDA